MPNYIASGGHYFGDVRYRFLILPRFDCDLHSLIKNRRVDTKNILIIADQLIDVLEHIHDNGYAHSDIKAENIMIGRCTYKQKTGQLQEQQKLTKSDSAVENKHEHNNGLAIGKRQCSRRRISSSSHDSGRDDGASSEDDARSESENYELDEDDEDEDDEDEGEDEGDDEGGNGEQEYDDLISESDSDGTSSHISPCRGSGKRQKERKNSRQTIEYSGSNPMRSCRMERKTPMYDDMVTSHYLRRSVKKVNYCDAESDGEETKHTSRYEDEDDDWESKHTYMKRLFSPIKDRSNNSTGIGGDTFNRNRTGKLGINGLDSDGDDDDNDDDDSEWITENRIHLIDFGLALKFIDSTGTHRPFVMDQRRAHDGTLEFTSRDAHMGAHSRRSDLECLAYNLIYWQEGFLPWKNEKLMSQPEQVHRMKEYFMTDIKQLKQLYKKIYGVAIPAYIHDFLAHVNNLAYHDRPNYKLCKEIFLREFLKMGYKQTDMIIDVIELKKKPIRKQDTAGGEIENNNVGQKLMDVTKMMQLGMILPLCESPTSKNRISPKNLRSKTNKNPKKRRKNFSWTEILSTDPDQIARQRAEKEFERDQTNDQTPVTHRYSGNPTYAILEVENNKCRSKLDSKELDTQKNENTIKGYTKPMMDVWRKRQLMLLQQFQINGKGKKKQTSTSSERSYNGSCEDVATATKAFIATMQPGNIGKITNTITNNAAATINPVFATTTTTNTINNLLTDPGSTLYVNQTPVTNKLRKRKTGLRRIITPSKKLIESQCNPPRRKKATASASVVVPATTTSATNSKISRQNTDEGYSGTDDSSNSSNIDLSEASHSTTGASATNANASVTATMVTAEIDIVDFSPVKTRRGRARKTTTNLKVIVISDEDSRDTTDYSPVKRKKRKSKTGKSGRRRSEQKAKKG